MQVGTMLQIITLKTIVNLDTDHAIETVILTKTAVIITCFLTWKALALK